jgi:nucleotide-binding universal stress UspA family protein
MRIETIVHATDFSPRSHEAFRLACSLAQVHKARLVVLHVLKRPTPVYSGVMTPELPPPPSEKERRLLFDRLQTIQAEPDIRLEHVLADGDPAAEIARVAAEERCGLIVMGTHGRTGLRRLLMGSVAEKVVREASCPVVTVKTPIRD